MEQPPPLPESQLATPPPSTSLAAKLLNVFAAPGEVFDEIKAAPSAVGNWLGPLLLAALVGVLYAIVMFSQPAIVQQVREQQDKALEQQVQAKKLTREQADQMAGMLDKVMGPTVLKITGSVMAVIFSAVQILGWALVLWLLGRWFLKVDFGYVKALEVVGLAMMIHVLGSIVALLLTVNLGRMVATASLALAVSNFDVNRKSHLVLGALNVFSFWHVSVLSIALARLAGVPFVRAAVPVFAYWVLQQSFFILTGMGQFAL